MLRTVVGPAITAAVMTMSVVVVVSTQSAPSQTEIGAAHAAYWNAFIGGDVETMAQHETAATSIIDNGTVLPAASERFAGIRKRGRIPNRVETLEVQSFRSIGADAAVVTGWLDRRLGERQARASITELWQRENGRWKLALATIGPSIESGVPATIPGAVRRDAIPSDLLAAIKRRDDAVRLRDGAAWSKEVTDRHLNLPPNGGVVTAADRMATISASTAPVAESQDEQFIVYGPSLVIYLYRQDMVNGRVRFVETWIKEASGWKLALRQGTPM